MVKYIPNFKSFLSIRSKPIWAALHFGEYGSYSFKRKKIISSKISVVRFNQIDFMKDKFKIQSELCFII